MKKILIIGGSHRDIPLIKSAKKLGLYTITVGLLDYYIGYKFSDKSYKIDFQDVDALKKLIKEEEIDYVIPGSGEKPMLIATELSRNGNYDNLTTFEILHSKDLFKKLCMKLDINVPMGNSINNMKELGELEFPLIVKPLNLSGGKGIQRVTNSKELTDALENSKKLSNNNKSIVEEFIEGPLIAYSVIFKNQKIIYSFSAEEYEENYYVTTTVKIDLDEEIKNILDKSLEKIAEYLKLKDGLLHVQFLLKNKKAMILEVTRRIPGDLFPTLIDLSDGVDYSTAVVKSYLGHSKDIEKLLIPSKNEYNLRYCILSKEDCILDYIYFDKNIKILERIDIFNSGERVFKNSLVSIVIIRYEKEILENLKELIYVKGIK